MDNSVGNRFDLPGNAIPGLAAEPANGLRVEIEPIFSESNLVVYCMALGTLWRMIERSVRERRGEPLESTEGFNDGNSGDSYRRSGLGRLDAAPSHGEQS